jgi:hypothetical protein
MFNFNFIIIYHKIYSLSEYKQQISFIQIYISSIIIIIIHIINFIIKIIYLLV